jgi:hypothetical protein
MEMPSHDGAPAMKRRRSIKKSRAATSVARRARTRPRRLTAEQRWIRTHRPLAWARGVRSLTDMMREAGVYAFSDRLAELEKDSGVNPKRVREILVSPLEPLGTWRDLEKELGEAEKELPHTLGMSRESVQARIDRIKKELAALAPEVSLGPKRWTKREGTGPPDDRFWMNAPADIPADERWLNPRDWPWLRKRAALLADYLSTTKLVNEDGPWRKGTARDRSGNAVGRIGKGRYDKSVLKETAVLVWLFYRFYFHRLVFTKQDVKRAVDLFYPPEAKPPPK